MMKKQLGKILMAAIVVTVSLSTMACSKTLAGKYANGSGLIVIEFSSDKAFVTMGGLTAEGAYKVVGDKVVIEAEGEEIVLMRNSDGSLSGPKDSFIGRLTKQRS